MAEPIPGVVHQPAEGWGRPIELLCRGFALFGGSILVAVALMSVASVVGRALFGQPVTGDFELVQMGSAIAVAAFLPYCQIRRSHVIVDFFTHKASFRTRRMLDIIGAVLLSACVALVAWRTVAGALALKENQETSMLLGVPIWYSYALIAPSLILLAIAGFYTAVNQPKK
jgi:TRAP-type C4-dicarboxylate transport system permease small subunit